MSNRLYLASIASVPLFLLVALTFAQATKPDQLDSKVAELRQQIQLLRDQRNAEMLKELGDRYKSLMDYSDDELRFALETKLREQFEGASILSAENDPVYLGKIADSLDPESIFNTVGQYGSDFGLRSIWNSVGSYGGAISTYSAFNDLTTKPPLIVKDNKVVGKLTTNRMELGAIDPGLLRICFTW